MPSDDIVFSASASATTCFQISRCLVQHQLSLLDIFPPPPPPPLPSRSTTHEASHVVRVVLAVAGAVAVLSTVGLCFCSTVPRRRYDYDRGRLALFSPAAGTRAIHAARDWLHTGTPSEEVRLIVICLIQELKSFGCGETRQLLDANGHDAA